jgi:hypothetical protein
VHVDAPIEVSSFSQESGRAGRDGPKAFSIMLLWFSWKPELERHLIPDQEAMQLYLSQQYYSCAVLSQFLDASIDWRWYMASNEPCQVYRTAYIISRPIDVVYTLPKKVQIEFTGSIKILCQDYL